MTDQSMSYTQLSQSLPSLSDKVLTERLDDLVGKDLVQRRTLPGFPRRTEYRLTERGLRLRPLMIVLYRTGIVLQKTGTAEQREPWNPGGAPTVSTLGKPQ